MNRRLDQGIVSAIEVFFMYGIDPGSCTSLLLQGKYDEAVNHAHSFYRAGMTEEWSSLLWFIDTCVPHCCKGANYNTWRGWIDESKENPELLTYIKLTLTDDTNLMLWLAQHEALCLIGIEDGKPVVR
jgi:hypothetical protein